MGITLVLLPFSPPGIDQTLVQVQKGSSHLQLPLVMKVFLGYEGIFGDFYPRHEGTTLVMKVYYPRPEGTTLAMKVYYPCLEGMPPLP